ncbi:MAG: hypothetical protein QM817_10780 [Archangium sp.]
MKNPIVLAVLDFITLGLGTAILGKKRSWGFLMMFGAGFLRFEELRIAPLQTGVFSIHWLWMLIGLTLMGLVMAIDVYRSAKEA